MSTASAQSGALDTIVERMGLKTLVESCLVLEEGVASAKDIEIGMMMGAGHPARARSRAPTRPASTRSSSARARPGGVGRRLRAAHRAARGWSPRAGSARRPARASSPTRSPTPATSARPSLLETRGDVAIAWLNRPPANPLSPQAVQELIDALGGGRRQGAGARDRLLEHLHVLRRRGHQGVHEDDARRRGRRPGRVRPPLHARDGAVVARSRSRRSTRSRSAAAASWRWRATSASRRSRPRSASPRSTSGSSPASAARSGCRGWWARRRRSR